MITITKKGLIGCGDSLINELKYEFTRRQCTGLPRSTGDELLEKIIPHVGTGNVIFASYLSIQSRNIALCQVRFLFNDPNLFRLADAISPGTENHGDEVFQIGEKGSMNNLRGVGLFTADLVSLHN